MFTLSVVVSVAGVVEVVRYLEGLGLGLYFLVVSEAESSLSLVLDSAAAVVLSVLVLEAK